MGRLVSPGRRDASTQTDLSIHPGGYGLLEEVSLFPEEVVESLVGMVDALSRWPDRLVCRALECARASMDGMREAFDCGFEVRGLRGEGGVAV